MFPDLEKQYGEQIDYFEGFDLHIHYYLRMKEKGAHYTAFATVASAGQSFSHLFVENFD